MNISSKNAELAFHQIWAIMPRFLGRHHRVPICFDWRHPRSGAPPSPGFAIAADPAAGGLR
ncbi:MAG: hypothetical protein CR217_12960 [Beijerinckiaceae bacterium]|nr:MAG: hypothetical protein CR217_12960 [Beijerinckiaceae bacterium]